MLHKTHETAHGRLVASTLILAFVFAFSQPNLFAQSTSAEKPRSADEVDRQWKKAGWKFDAGWKPVTNPAVAKVWGVGIEKAMTNGDMTAIKKFIDFDPVLEHCVAGISDEDFRRGFLIGVTQGTEKLLIRLSSKEGSYRYRGVRNTEYGACALLRMLDGNGGCNYHLWRLQKNKRGEVRGVDMYIFLSGESFGDTVRRMTLLSVPKDDRSFLQKLTGTEQTMSKHQGQMMQIMQATQQQNFKSVLTGYDKLPANLKNEKAFMVIRMMAAMQVDDAEYVKALDDFQKQYPGDASADLAGIDLFFLKKQYGKMHEAINRLEKAVGKDAHLGMLRAIGFSQEGKLTEAQSALEEAISIEPGLEGPHWTMVEVCLSNKDFAKVNDTLKKLVTQFGYNEFDFSVSEIYAEYLKSEQYKQFTEFLKTLDQLR